MWRVNLAQIAADNGEFVHLNVIKATWGGAADFASAILYTTEMPCPEIENQMEESYIGECYEGIPVGISGELAALVVEYLGVSSTDEVTLVAYDEAGNEVTDNGGRGATDGWRNAEGAFTSWGAEGCTYYVQPYADLTEGEWSFGAYMGSYPDAVTEEVTFTQPIGFRANGKTVKFNVGLNYVEQTYFTFYPEVGADDNSTEFFTDFSEVYTIQKGQTANFKFYNYSAADQSQHNWMLIAAESGADYTVAENQYFVQRADANGWGTYYDRAQNDKSWAYEDWDEWTAKMNGAYVDMDVTFDGTSVKGLAVMLAADLTPYFYAFGSKTFDEAESISFILTTEKGHLRTNKDLNVEVQDMETVTLTMDYTDTGYTGVDATYDADAALDAIGLESLDDAVVLAWDPVEAKYVRSAMATYDGWFNAEGQPATWGSTNCSHCVKFYTDGTIWACMFPNYDSESDVLNVVDVNNNYSAVWLLVNEETGAAYQVEAVVTCDENVKTGIETANGKQQAANSQYFNLAGQKVQAPVKGQVYIVNGKKVLY